MNDILILLNSLVSEMVKPQGFDPKKDQRKENNSISMLLSKLSLKLYANDFKENDIDLEAFGMLTPEVLNELGIQNPKKIEEIMTVIKSLKINK